MITNPSEWPDSSEIIGFEEPWVKWKLSLFLIIYLPS